MLRALVPSGSGRTGHTHSSPGLLTGRSRPDLLTISPPFTRHLVCVCVIPSVCVTPGEYVGGCACVLCHVRLSLAPCTVAHQAPLSMGFPRQEYWSELPFPPQGDFPNPGIKPMSPVSSALADGCFTTEPSGKPMEQEVASVKESIEMTYSNCFWHLSPQSFNSLLWDKGIIGI